MSDTQVNQAQTSHPRGWDMDLLKKMNVKVWSYLEEFKDEQEDIQKAITKVLTSGNLILGPHVQQFEQEFSAFCDQTQGIGVNSCTDGLILSMRAMDIGKGDEVITVANTAVPTVAAIAATGATAKFVDIDPHTYLMNLDLLEQAITPKTKCIIPVHLFGQCVDMDRLNAIAAKHGLKVIEDCAQAHGATYKGRKAGSMSQAGVFSFYPTKVLGAFGDAGMVVTNDTELADRIRGLRVYGMRGRYYALEPGVNSRLDEMQAAILMTKLPRLSAYIQKRQALAALYDRLLPGSGLTLPRTESFNDTHCYYLYVVRHPKRDLVMDRLKDQGIFVNVSYEWPIHTMPAFHSSGYTEGDLPETERSCKEIFSLPMYPGLPLEDAEKVCHTLHHILKDL